MVVEEQKHKLQSPALISQEKSEDKNIASEKIEANSGNAPNIMIVNNMQTQEAAEEGLGQSPKVNFENTA